MQRFCSFLGLFSLLAFPQPAPRRANGNLLLDVIQTTHDIHRTETLIYLRVYSDGLAEGHPTHYVDFRNLALKQAHVPAGEMAKLREILSRSNTRSLSNKYERFWGNKDFGTQWKVTIFDGQAKKTISLINFQPFLAVEKRQPYPAEIDKLGCAIWELRTNVLGEPLDRDYVRGCQEWGY